MALHHASTVLWGNFRRPMACHRAVRAESASSLTSPAQCRVCCAQPGSTTRVVANPTVLCVQPASRRLVAMRRVQRVPQASTAARQVLVYVSRARQARSQRAAARRRAAVVVLVSTSPRRVGVVARRARLVSTAAVVRCRVPTVVSARMRRLHRWVRARHVRRDDFLV